MSLAALGPLVASGITLVALILALLSFRARRADKRASNLAAVMEMNIAQANWIYETRMRAARNGWQLPELPKEMTPEYLAGRAEGEGNPELAQLADLAKNIVSPGS